MDTFWIIAAAMIVVLLSLMVRLMVMRRSYRHSGREIRLNAGKSYFARYKSCCQYTFEQLKKLNGPKRLLKGLRIAREGAEDEIDILMVHETGIYVFDIKEYGGILNGEESGGLWTLAFENGRMENFPNPIRQSRAQIRVLQEQLENVPARLFYLYIVFGQRCELRTVPGPTENTAVVGSGDLPSALENNLAQRAQALSQEQIEGIFEKLKIYARKRS